MDTFSAQRMILALEANTTATHALTQWLQHIPSPTPCEPITIPKAAKALGLSAPTAWRKVRSGEWPSEGKGRNTRVNLAAIQQIRQQAAAVNC